MNSIKIDLHSHSISSKDGGITLSEYKHTIRSGLLDFIAITDHDQIDYALTIHKKLGDSIIVGEEVSTTQGEIIGLYLSKIIPAGMSAMDTVRAIKAQNGIVYIPHPFETVRKGITKQTLDEIATFVDIIEAHNGRAFFQNKGPEAVVWARLNGVSKSASSDAHGRKGIGTTYTAIAFAPTQQNLVSQLQKGRLYVDRPPLSSLLYPKYNRIRAKLKRK